ncbi:cytochrome C biogenesis protein [Candidatus Bathyarchaeota archaeon]|nr:cytochrome C biogenesis protein [Candidatus Bathyarchaeota archaeon]|tara:strand:- start:4781 stop:6700 length:1920 start_codon:yes stop_codon:yes gene_type:complete
MIGFASLVVAAVVMELTVVFYVVGLYRKRSDLERFGDHGVKASFALFTLASIYLLYLLLTKDFNNLYVSTHTNRNLPTVYVVSAFWAGQEGSLLLWGWLTSLTALIVARKQISVDKFKPYVATILIIVQLFFVLTMIFASNPFERQRSTPADGQGLNPLLQDPGMVLHPPTLFVGYALIAVPFAYAMAGLMTKDEEWLSKIRTWTLLSWLFLSLGIALGGWWSYHVLGWGGYWAWDPVENASLMPWLIITAFLHSVVIQEGKKGMKLWNMLLITFSFLLVIYAAFLTRSGIIQSIHSFSGSSLGQYFGIFLGISTIATVALIAKRYVWLKSRNIFEAYLSKESAFLFNNLLFTVLTLLIMLGTIFPLLSEAVRGYQVRVGPGYFQQTASPLSVMLIFLMGLCPLIAWRQASVASLKRNLTFPFLITIATTIVLYSLGVTQLGGMVVSASIGFSLGSILQEFYRATDPEDSMPLGKRFLTLFSAAKQHQRRYGGYIIHLSMILIIGGIAGSTFYENSSMVTLGIDEPFVLGPYTIEMTDLYSTQEAERQLYFVLLDIYKGGSKIYEADPSVAYFFDREMTIRYPWVKSQGLSDLYLIYESSAEGRATFTFKIIPQVTLIWVGTILGILGSIVTIWKFKRK